MPYYLSYTLRKKTEKLLELKARTERQPHLPMIYVASILGMYILWFNDRYFFYLCHFLLKTPFILVTPLHTPQWLAIPDALVFAAFAILAIIAYRRATEYRRLVLEFETLRKNIIQSIAADFCHCQTQCDCKDEYIQAMEQQGINLIY